MGGGGAHVATELVVEEDEHGVGELQALVGQVEVPGLVADGALPRDVLGLAGQGALGPLQGRQELLPVVQAYVPPPARVEVRPDILQNVLSMDGSC